ARVGIPYSPTTGLPITSQTVSQMVDKVMEMAEGTRLYLLAPIVRGRKGEYRKEFMELLKAGFQRVKVDGEFYDIEDVPDLNKKIKHNIEVVVDRLVVRPDLETRLADSIETALQLSDGLVVTEVANDGAIRTLFSAKFACPVSGFTIEEIEPRLFSFNNPFGACPTCDGLGQKLYFDPELVVPDKRLSLNDGALAPWGKSNSPYYSQTLESLGRHFGFKTNTSYEKLPKNIQDVLLYGSGDEEVEIIYKSDNIKSYKIKKIFEGIIGNIKRRWRETDSLTMRDELSKYQSSTTCDACSGHRLKAEALAVKIDGKHISEITELSVRKSYDWFQGLTTKLTDKENEIASRVLKEISERLGFLNNVGLEYLNLSRKSGTLSGGESQRIRLASQIGSGLTGVLYVLDEPSIGLHQRDNSRLLQTLSNLRDMGNSVLVVEHDEEAILSADHVIDMGPGAGIHGGEVVAQGTPKQIMSNKKSLTGKYLSGKLSIPIPAERRKGHFAGKKRKEIVISGASSNNLKNITAKFPLGLMTCVTGVSGSGKSTLTIDTLYKAVARKVNRNRVIPGKHDTITGLEFIDKIVEIDQSPIGRTPRSNPATYTGAFTPIRDWFSSLPESKTRGYKPGRFSFNVKGGRCEACQGDGLIKIEMHFLPDVYVKCDVCDGNRYNRETLEIKFKGKSISDILNMTVEDGVKFFAAIPSVCDKIKMMQKVGLDYIKIGQAATTLSGGEAQRVKLSKELSKRSTGRTLYILDEPTTGLHFEDIKKLLEVIQALVDMGNTVIIIEHNLDVIKTADWVIDIGPEGGSGGGMIIAEGTPEKVARVKDSFTGYYLQKVLKYK
ncbi:MAG: excinuclease ABC subunit UvrA, partial [Emcibacteraceae bacterium]